MWWQTAVYPGIQHGSGWPGPCVTTACLFQAIGDLQRPPIGCKTFCCTSPSRLWRLQKTRGTGFEDVGNIETSTFESWDWSVQFPVTALCAVAVGFQKGGLNNVSFWHLTGSLPVVTMQLARAFMAVCLGYIASLSLQGCGSDDDTLSVATDGDANTTTMTETMTVTTTAGDTVTATTTMTVTETMTSTMTETMTSTMTDTVTVTSTMTETVTSTSTVTTVASLWVLHSIAINSHFAEVP